MEFAELNYRLFHSFGHACLQETYLETSMVFNGKRTEALKSSNEVVKTVLNRI